MQPCCSKRPSKFERICKLASAIASTKIFFQAFHAELSSEEFAETCDGMSAKYQAVASVTLASTQCEITRYPFKGRENGNCTIRYRLSLNDGVTAQEIHEWYLENGEYYWVDLYWPEEQAEN